MAKHTELNINGLVFKLSKQDREIC